MVVESNGFVYVDAVIPTVAPASIRFQIEQPVIVYNQTAARGVGSRLIADTAGLSFRVKSFINAVPSEIAVLNASSSDTIAVFRTTPVMANGVVHTNYFSTRLPTGESVSISVNRPLAVGPTDNQSAFSKNASLTMSTVATSCARRVFSLLAPPLLAAQATTQCANERRAVSTAAAVQAGTFAIGAGLIVGGIIQVVGGVAASAVIPLSGSGATFNGVMQIGGTLFGMGVATWAYNDAVAALNACGSGPKPRLTRAVPPSK